MSVVAKVCTGYWAHVAYSQISRAHPKYNFLFEEAKF